MAREGFHTDPDRINRNGRPKGSPNKSTKQIRDAFQCFVENNLETLQVMFDEIKRPQDKLNFMKELSEYIIPKLSRSEIEIEEKPTIDLSKLTPETLQKLKDELNADTDTSGDS